MIIVSLFFLAKAIQNLLLPIFSPIQKWYMILFYVFDVRYRSHFQTNSNSSHKIGLHVPDNYDQDIGCKVAIFDSYVTNTVHYNTGFFCDISKLRVFLQRALISSLKTHQFHVAGPSMSKSLTYKILTIFLL